MSPACACLQGLEAVEGLSLEGCGSGSPASKIFTCDPRILDAGSATLSSCNFGGLSRLAYLEWHAAQDIASLPSTLATLDLSGSNRLGGLPDLERLTGLQQLDLGNCLSLDVLPEALGALTAAAASGPQRVHISSRAAGVAGRADSGCRGCTCGVADH